MAAQALDWLVLLFFSLFFAIPLYWIPVHGAIRLARRLGRRAYWWGLAVWMLSLWVFAAHFHFWFASRCERFWLLALPGAALLALEVVVAGRVGTLLGFARLVGRSEVEPERFRAAMTRSGLYARVRHPRYTSAMAALFGLAVLGGSWRLLAAAAVSVPLYYLVTALEERELIARFGEEYRAYRDSVPRFIPGFRRHR